MKLEECFEVFKEAKILFSKVGIDNLQVHITGPHHIRGTCENLNEYTETIIMTCEDESITNLFIENYHLLDFEWVNEPENDEDLCLKAEARIQPEPDCIFRYILTLQLY